MTALAPLSIKTKKQLKEHLAEGKYLELVDPNPWGNDVYMLNHNGKHEIVRTVGNKVDMQLDASVFCTNHPKRTWFAQIKLTEKGLMVL